MTIGRICSRTHEKEIFSSTSTRRRVRLRQSFGSTVQVKSNAQTRYHRFNKPTIKYELYSSLRMRQCPRGQKIHADQGITGDVKTCKTHTPKHSNHHHPFYRCYLQDQADVVAGTDVTADENVEHLNQTDITDDNQGHVTETDVTGDNTEDSQQTGVTDNKKDQIAQNVTETDGVKDGDRDQNVGHIDAIHDCDSVYNAESSHQTDDIENEAGAQNLDSLSTSVHQTDDLNSGDTDEEHCEEINSISVVNKDLDVMGNVNVEDQNENGGKTNTQQLCSCSNTTAASVQSMITEENVERVKKILIKPKIINSNNQTISPDRPTSEEDVERVKKILVSPKIMNPCKQTTSPDSPRSDVETFEFMRCPSVIQQSTSLELFTPRESIDRITVIVPNPNSPESTGQESCSDQEKSSCSNEATTVDVEFEIGGLSPNIVHLTEDKETNVMCDGLDTSSGVDQTQQSRFGCNYPQTTSISTELESKSPRTVEKNGEESESDYLSPIDGFMSPVYPFPFQNHQQDMDTPGHFHGLVDVLQNKESPPTDIAEISNGKLDFNNVENRIVDVDQSISRTGSMGDLQDKDTGIENSHRQTIPFHTRRDEADFQQPLDCNTPSNGIMSETTTVELEKEQKQETNQHERPSIMNSPQSIQNSDRTNHEETDHQEIPSIIIQNYRLFEDCMAREKRSDTPTIISNTVSEMVNSIERNSFRVTVNTQIPLMTIPTEQSQDRSQEEDSAMSPRHDFPSPNRLPKITFFKESPKTPIDPCKDRLIAFQSPDGLPMTERTEPYTLKESPKTHTDQETTNRIFTKLPESKSSPLTTDSDREEQTTSIADFNSGISFDLLQIANNIVDTYQSSLKKKETISNDHIDKEAIISNNGYTRKITSNSEKSPKKIFSVVDMISNTSSELKSPQHSTSQSVNGTDPIQNKDETALLTTPMVIRIPLIKLPSFKNGTRVVENERINFNNNSIDGTTSTMNPNEQLDLNTNSIEDTTNSPSKEYESTGNTGSRSPEVDITSTSCATTRITPNLIIDTFPTTETIGEVTTPSYKEVVSVSSNESTPSPFISSPTIAKSFDGSRRNSNNEVFSVSGTEDGSSSQNNVQKPCSRDSNNDSEIVAKVPSDPPISSSLDENNVSTLTQLKQSDSQEGSQDAATIHCIKADSPPVYEKFRMSLYGKFDTEYNEVNNNVPVRSRTLSTDDDLLKEVIEKDEKKSMLMFGHQSKQQNIPVIKSLMDDLFDMCSSQEESSHEMTQDSDSQPESQERIGIHQARNQVEGIGNIIDVDDTRDGSSSNLTSIDLPVREDLQDSINKTTKNLSEAEPTDTNIEKHPTLKSPEAEEDLQYMMRLISSNLKRMIEESSTGDLKDVQPVNVASVDLEDIEIINLPVENIVDNEEGTAAEPEDEDSTINGNTAKQRSVDAAALVSENSTIDTDNSTRSMVHTENSTTRLKNVSTHLNSSVSLTKQPLKDVNNNYEEPEDVQNEDEDVNQSQDSSTESYATSQADYDSDKENIENVPITFVSDSDVKKLRVDNKQSHWTKKCYSLRHDFKRVYEDISSDDEFTRLKKEREQIFGYRPVYEEISAEESETDFEADHPPTNRKSISKKSEPKPVYSPIKSGRDTEESDCDLEQKLKLLSDRQPVVKLEKLNVKKKQSNTEVRRGEAKAVPKSKTRLTELKSKVKKNVNSVKSGLGDLKWISCLNKPTSLFMDSSDIPLKIKTVGKVAKESPLMSDFLVSDEAPLKTTKKNRSRPTSPDIKGKKNRSRSNTPTLDVPARTVKKSRSRPTTPTVDTPPLKTNKKSRSRPSSPINDTPPMKISRSNSTDCQPSKQKSREFKIPKKAKSPCKTRTTEKDLQSSLSADQDNTAFLGSHNKKQNSKLPETTPTNAPPVCIDPQTQPDPTSFPLDTILGNMASLSTSLKVKSSRGSEVLPTSSTSNQLSGTTTSHTFPSKVCSQQEPNDQSLNGVSNKTLNSVQVGPMDEDLVPVPTTNQRKNEEAPIPSQAATSTDQTSDLNTQSPTTNSIPSSSLLLKSSGNQKPISGAQGLDPKLELVGQTKDPGIVKTNDLSRPVQHDTLKLSSKKTQGQHKLSTISTNKAQQTNESYRPQSTVSKESKSKQKVSFAEFIAKKKGMTAPSTKDLTSVEVKKAPNQVETTRSSTKEPPSTASTSPDTDDITKFVDEELERQIEKQYQLKSPEMNFTPLKNTSQRQIVLSETIQKLRKLRNQGNQQQEPDSVKITPRAETKTKGSSTSDKGSAMVDKGSTTSGKVLAPLQISTDTSKCPKPGVDLLSPTNSISSICSIASNESETKIIETDFGKMKVKKSYLKLPHRHEDGVRCVTFCHRLPQNYKEVDERVLQTQQQQDVRDAPSRAYFKFPHRHSDGTYCETVCSRVLQRETMRSQTQTQPPPTAPKVEKSYNIPWKLIPITFDDSNKNLLDPRLNSRESENPASPDHDDKIDEIVFSPFKSKAIPTQDPRLSPASNTVKKPPVCSFPDQRPTPDTSVVETSLQEESMNICTGSDDSDSELTTPSKKGTVIFDSLDKKKRSEKKRRWDIPASSEANVFNDVLQAIGEFDSKVDSLSTIKKTSPSKENMSQDHAISHANHGEEASGLTTTGKKDTDNNSTTKNTAGLDQGTAIDPNRDDNKGIVDQPRRFGVIDKSPSLNERFEKICSSPTDNTILSNKETSTKSPSSVNHTATDRTHKKSDTSTPEGLDTSLATTDGGRTPEQDTHLAERNLDYVQSISKQHLSFHEENTNIELKAALKTPNLPDATLKDDGIPRYRPVRSDENLLEKQNAVDTKSKKIKMPSLPFVSGRNTPSPTDHMATTLPNTGLQRRLSSSGSSLYSPTNPTCLSSNNNSAEASPNPPSRQPSSFEFPLDRTWGTDKSPLDNNSALVKNPLKELSMQKHMQSTMFPFPPAVFPQNSNSSREWNPLPFLNPSNQYPSLSLSSVSSGSLTSPIIPSPQSCSSSPSLWSVFSKALSPLLTAKQHTTRRTSSSTSTSSSTTGPLSPRENRKLTPLHALQESPTHLEAQVTSNIWQRNASTLLIKTPTIPISQNPEIMSLLDKLMLESLDKLIHEYFNEAPTFQEKSYLLEIARDFILGLLEKGNVTSEDLLLQVVDAGIRDALMSVQSRKQEDGYSNSFDSNNSGSGEYANSSAILKNRFEMTRGISTERQSPVDPRLNRQCSTESNQDPRSRTVDEFRRENPLNWIPAHQCDSSFSNDIKGRSSPVDPRIERRRSSVDGFQSNRPTSTNEDERINRNFERTNESPEFPQSEHAHDFETNDNLLRDDTNLLDSGKSFGTRQQFLEEPNISQEENQNFLNDPRLQSSRQSNITTSPLLVEHDEHDIEISESTIPKWKPIYVKSTETKGFRDFSLPRQDETRSDVQHLEDIRLKRSRRSSTNIEVDARDCHSDSEQGWGGRWNPYETAEDGEICDEVSRKARRKKIPKQYATDDEEYYEGGRTNDEVDSEIERYIDEKVKNGSARGLDSDHSETSEDEIDANKDRKRKRSEKQKDKRDIKKKKKSRRRSSSDSDQSPYRGSNQGYRNMPTTIDIKVKLHNRRKVTVKRNDWIKPKQQMARHVMTKPTDLASTRLSLADIEQLNQMNSQAFMEENQSHKKSQPFADRRAKQYSVPRYDTITERIRDIRHSTSIKSPPQKSRRVSSATTSKENDLRSTITRISEKRTAQKKRGGFL